MEPFSYFSIEDYFYLGNINEYARKITETLEKKKQVCETIRLETIQFEEEIERNIHLYLNIEDYSLHYVKDDTLNMEVIYWTVNDVYRWIMNVNIPKSILIAQAFKEEEIDGCVFMYLKHSEVEELFKEHSLNNIGLFWLAILNCRRKMILLN